MRFNPDRPTRRKRIAAMLVLAAFFIAPVTGFVACARESRSDHSAAEQLRRFAQRMERARDLTYTAEYDAGGVAVTHAQAPPRQVYRATGTTLILGPDTVVLCRTGASPPAQPRDVALTPGCERTPGIDGITLPQARAVSPTLAAPHFVAPEVAAALVLRAAGRPGLHVATARQSVDGADTDCATVRTGAGSAGTPAGASAGGVAGGQSELPPLRFTACVTATGVLARFEGTTDSGMDGQTTLVRLALTTAPDAFNLPPGLAVQDPRTGV